MASYDGYAGIVDIPDIPDTGIATRAAFVAGIISTIRGLADGTGNAVTDMMGGLLVGKIHLDEPRPLGDEPGSVQESPEIQWRSLIRSITLMSQKKIDRMVQSLSPDSIKSLLLPGVPDEIVAVFASRAREVLGENLDEGVILSPLEKAKIFIHSGDNQRAQDLCETLVADPETSRFDKAEAYLNLWKLDSIQEGNPLMQALQLDPENPEILFEVGLWMESLNSSGSDDVRRRNLELMEYAYRAAARKGHAGAHKHLSSMYSEKGVPERALAHLKEAARLQPEIYLSDLIRSYFERGEREKVEELALKAAREVLTQALTTLGNKYGATGDRAKSRGLYEMAIKNGDLKANIDLGISYYTDGKIFEATRCFRAALDAGFEIELFRSGQLMHLTLPDNQLPTMIFNTILAYPAVDPKIKIKAFKKLNKPIPRQGIRAQEAGFDFPEVTLTRELILRGFGLDPSDVSYQCYFDGNSKTFYICSDSRRILLPQDDIYKLFQARMEEMKSEPGGCPTSPLRSHIDT